VTSARGVGATATSPRAALGDVVWDISAERRTWGSSSRNLPTHGFIVRLLHRVVSLCAVPLLVCAGAAFAQTGVSDNRVSLPDGPGSLEGVGDDVSVTGNMGAMAYGVSMASPPGYAGLTPSLGLSYSSAGGAGIAGMGWSMPMPSIERLTVRGVPDYDTDDEFTADSGQLVYVEGTNPRVYRSRFEGAFVRYRWYDPGAGDGGYWTAEYPDGRVGWFGADREGRLQGSARVGADDGVFRYLLVDLVDVHGHRLHHEWSPLGGTTLLESMQWVFVDGAPSYEAVFDYEPRRDVILDGTGGFVESLEHRLVSVATRANGATVDRWDLTYEPYGASGGFSRLQSVQRFGVGGEPYPVSATFAYSSALGEICDGVGCDRPFVRSLGNIGVNIATGDPQLIDINGDALPDIVDSTLTGAPHRIFLNTLTADGDHFFARPYDSAVGAQDGFDFSNARVQLLDVDGDGFTDAANLATGAVLRNEGTGDWIATGDIDTVTLPDFENPTLFRTLRFVDIDNDRRIDLLRASGTGASHTTRIYRNTGEGYVELDGAEPLGRGFDAEALEVNDFNGDGLVDAAEITTAGVRYRLNLGHGRWWPADDWAHAAFDDAGLEASEIVDAELEDLNGDGLADVVLVRGSAVRVWVNRAGQRYEALAPITDADVDGVDGASIPSNTATTTVLFADVNANGSSDIVWVTASGDVTALELFPVRPNLLAEVENGLGVTMRVEYGTSVEQMARDAATELEWTNPLPFANLVVTATATDDSASGVGWRTEYAYHDGFYDGVEKQFRGYRVVETTVIGDEHQPGASTIETYALGVDDPYAAGPVVASALVDDTGAPIHTTTHTYADCPVDVDDTGLRWPIRFRCPTAIETVLQDGADPDEWVTTRSESTFDAQGNLIEAANLGVVAVGGSTTCSPCDADAIGYGAACGAGCLGDEVFEVSTYIAPGDATDGAWILRMPSRMATYGDAAHTDLGRETVYHYDGASFEGLPEGRLTRGLVTRVMRRVDGDRWIADARNAHDAHGNVVESLRAEGDPGAAGHRVRTAYAPDGLRIAAVEIEVDDQTTLRRDYDYEPTRRLVREIGHWYRVDAPDAPTATRVAYDAFGRVVAQVLPGGDTFASPTAEYDYRFGEHGAWVHTRARTTPGGPWDRESVTCSDGFGRPIQARVRNGDAGWIVSRTTRYGRLGSPVVTWDNFVAASGACDFGITVPDGLGATRTRYDSVGRVTRSEYATADGDVLASASVYAPGRLTRYDANDLDPDHPDFDTPEVRRFNGLGQLVSVGRQLERGGPLDTWSMRYDAGGQLARLTDPHGNTRTQRWDRLGRVVEVDDPDRGVLTWTYDDNGNVVAATDATGTVRTAYDGADRQIEMWVDGDRDATLQEILWDGDPSCPGMRCTFGVNRPVGVRGPTALGPVTEWRGYDALGRTIWSHLDVRGGRPGAAPLERTWRFDASHALVAATFAPDVEVAFERDGAGRPTAMPGILDAIAYDDRGAVASLQGANGVRTDHTYDGFHRLTGIDVTGPGDASVLDLGIVQDPAGRVTEVRDGLADGMGPSRAARYTYDAYDRLIAADLDMGSPAAESITYAYDAIDNLVSRTSSLGIASPVHDAAREIDPNHPHRVIGTASGTVAYDAAGRVTLRGDIATTWDGFGVLHRVEEPTIVTTYDHLMGRRIVETTDDGGVVLRLGEEMEIRDGVGSALVEVGTATVARVEFVVAESVYPDLAPARADAAGPRPLGDRQINAADAWLTWADARGYIALGGPEFDAITSSRTLTAAAAVLLVDRGDRVTWHHRDWLGSVAAVTDADGEVVEETLYYPFGHERFTTTQIGEPIGFSEMPDGAGRTVAFPLRDYDPLLGRWLKPDVAFDVVSASELHRPWEAFGAYSYVMNAPTSSVDANGATGSEIGDLPSFAAEDVSLSDSSTWAVSSSGSSSTSDSSTSSHTRSGTVDSGSMTSNSQTSMTMLSSIDPNEPLAALPPPLQRQDSIGEAPFELMRQLTESRSISGYEMNGLDGMAELMASDMSATSGTAVLDLSRMSQSSMSKLTESSVTSGTHTRDRSGSSSASISSANSSLLDAVSNNGAVSGGVQNTAAVQSTVRNALGQTRSDSLSSTGWVGAEPASAVPNVPSVRHRGGPILSMVRAYKRWRAGR